MGTVGVRARTHMVLLVEAGGDRWLADVGFGADGLLHPVALNPGAECAQFAWKHRVMVEGADSGQVEAYSSSIAEAIRREIGA